MSAFGRFKSADDRRPPTCFGHRAKVLVGANRRPGRIMRCESKKTGGEYWKVLLDSGEWVWPENVILATPGATVATCEMGGGRFMTDEQGDGLLCPRHTGEVFGTPEDHALDAATPPLRPSGNTHKWTPGRRRR